MKTLGIMFEQAQDIVDFVDAINRFDCPIDLKTEDCLVDAKSIISAFALSAIPNIEMQIHSEEYEDIIDSVKPFVKIYEE